jgi:hypothetical protein
MSVGYLHKGAAEHEHCHFLQYFYFTESWPGLPHFDTIPEFNDTGCVWFFFFMKRINVV